MSDFKRCPVGMENFWLFPLVYFIQMPEKPRQSSSVLFRKEKFIFPPLFSSSTFPITDIKMPDMGKWLHCSYLTNICVELGFNIPLSYDSIMPIHLIDSLIEITPFSTFDHFHLVIHSNGKHCSFCW